MTTIRTNLVAVPNSGMHDLPPRWDGCAVIWRGWEAVPGFICGRTAEAACESCGSLAQPALNMGLVGDDPAMSHDDVKRDDEATNLAVAYRSRRPRRSWIRLVAFRCVDCGADSVVDSDREVWNLDPSDYGECGSVPPATRDGGNHV